MKNKTFPATSLDSVPYVIGHFDINKKYKGEINGKSAIKIPLGICGYDFQIGKMYFIYASKDKDGGYEIKSCGRSAKISEAQEDIRFVNDLNSRSSTQSVIGEIQGLSDQDYQNITIKIQSKNKTIENRIEKNGVFNLQTNHIGQSKVSIVFPFEVELTLVNGKNDFDIETRQSSTILTYNVYLGENKCDYRMLIARKREKSARSSIKGRILDKNGNSLPNLKIYLYSTQDVEDLKKTDYKYGFTDKDGNLIFDKLEAGKYIVGINLSGTLELNTPYPQLYLLQDRVVDKETKINISENSEFDLGSLRLPPKLIKQKINGRLLWKDGSSVTQSSISLLSASKPILYLVDPNSYNLIPPLFDNGEWSVNVDDEGNFTFWGYEGVDYIIHAHAFDIKNKSFHAQHIKLKISKNAEPLTLKLLVAGVGDDAKTIKKEISE